MQFPSEKDLLPLSFLADKAHAIQRFFSDEVEIILMAQDIHVSEIVSFLSLVQYTPVIFASSLSAAMRRADDRLWDAIWENAESGDLLG